MVVFLNGKIIPEDQAVVSIFDRSFLYGDGLFETMVVANGALFRWESHLERWQRGAAFLGITPPFSSSALRTAAGELIQCNQTPHALLRLSLSRGIGVRGYSPRGADSPVVTMTVHPVVGVDPNVLQNWHLRTSNCRLPANEPLAQFKTCNKLPQILARAHAENHGGDEALLLNTDGFVVEGASSNLFWIRRDTVCTPPLASGILSGVTRLVVLELCRKLGLTLQERNITASELLETDGVFLSLSSFGIVQGASLDDQPLRQSSVTELVRAAYFETLTRETAHA